MLICLDENDELQLTEQGKATEDGESLLTLARWFVGEMIPLMNRGFEEVNRPDDGVQTWTGSGEVTVDDTILFQVAGTYEDMDLERNIIVLRLRWFTVPNLRRALHGFSLVAHVNDQIVSSSFQEVDDEKLESIAMLWILLIPRGPTTFAFIPTTSLDEYRQRKTLQA